MLTPGGVFCEWGGLYCSGQTGLLQRVVGADTMQRRHRVTLLLGGRSFVYAVLLSQKAPLRPTLHFWIKTERP
jgi:hypothetical protein